MNKLYNFDPFDGETTTRLMDWRILIPINDVDMEKVNTIAQSIRENGWNDRPLLAIGNEEDACLITGSHRLKACQILDIDVPVELIYADYFDWYDKGLRLDNEGARFELLEEYGNEYQKRLLSLEEE